MYSSSSTNAYDNVATLQNIGMIQSIKLNILRTEQDFSMK